jgi:sialic acid synthase SpsE
MEIIVDLCNQHLGDINELKRMAINAFAAGADTVKVQLMDSEKYFGDTSKKYRDITYDHFEELYTVCENLGIGFMASVFDEERLEWVNSLGITRHKIASRVAKHDTKLCEKILNDNKETLISTGMHEIGEFPYGFDKNIKYLFCVSKYPTMLYDERLKKIPNEFNKKGYYGYSDHTIGISAPLTAYMNGAAVLEKHFSNNIYAQSKFEKGHLCSFDSESLKSFKDLVKELDILRK